MRAGWFSLLSQSWECCSFPNVRVLQLLHLNGTSHRCLQGYQQGMPSSGARPSLDEAAPQGSGAALVGRVWMLLAGRSFSPHFLPVRRLMTA